MYCCWSRWEAFRQALCIPTLLQFNTDFMSMKGVSPLLRRSGAFFAVMQLMAFILLKFNPLEVGDFWPLVSNAVRYYTDLHGCFVARGVT